MNTCRILAVSILLMGLSLADEAPSLSEGERAGLAAGQCLVLNRRPDDRGSPDHRFVTTARLMEGTRAMIWEVINDKDHAAEFIDGVLESKVIEKSGNRILVEQLTRVGGPKGAYRYRLLHELVPMKKASFTYAGGELKNVIGCWWIFDSAEEGKCLVVYSLYIDAGLFAPQVIVKAGMKQSMPKTMESIAREVRRRSAQTQ